MDYGPFKTEHRVDGMTLIRFPEGEPTVASNVEVFCFQRIADLEAALRPFADLAHSWTVQTAVNGDLLLTVSNGQRMCGISASAFVEAGRLLKPASD